jgi:sedoheptulose-bisphosphatase
MILIWHSYEHHSIEEPAILLGGSFMVDAVDQEKEKK